MAEIFAKLFDTSCGQLLAFLDETADGEPAITVIGAAVRDVVPRSKMSGWLDGEAGQLRAFAKIDASVAENSAKSLHDIADKMAK